LIHGKIEIGVLIVTKFQSANSVDFKGLIMGFSGAALQHMGDVTKKDEKFESNMDLAHQNIEILSILAEKTKGNLTDEEDALIRQLLLDLRIRFIEKTRGTR
jgi:Domain of unknown function (DUF1844)